MAAMTDDELNLAARHYAVQAYRDTVADLNHADIRAAVAAIDGALEGPPTALPNQAASLAVNFNQVLPSPFKGTSTLAQKSILMASTVGVKYGQITGV